MKALKLAYLVAFVLATVSVYAQKKAEPDNNMHITVVRTEKVSGRVKEIHFTITNISAVSMDFSLYTQLSNGSWDINHHLDLGPGATYEIVSGFTSVTGKYVVFSAAHSDWASFPSQFDIDKVLATNPGAATAATPTSTTTTNSGTPSTAQVKTTPSSSSAPGNNTAPPPKDNNPPPVPPPM